MWGWALGWAQARGSTCPEWALRPAQPVSTRSSQQGRFAHHQGSTTHPGRFTRVNQVASPPGTHYKYFQRTDAWHPAEDNCQGH